MIDYVLEPAAAEFAAAAAQGPRVYELTPSAARATLEDTQSGRVVKPEADSRWITVEAEGVEVRICVIKPVGAQDSLPVVLYLHGGGWMLGSSATHDRLLRELAAGVPAAVAFVDYDRAPEARYPVALEQAYAAARWIQRNGPGAGLDGGRLAVAGDSAGGNLAAALVLLAKRRGDVSIVHQSLYYPVTDASQTTQSYREFADGPYLTAQTMAWFWDAYLPDIARRDEVLASPVRAGIAELSGLPDAFVVVDEYDVLRDEGEAYARNLTAAGVRCTSVRYNATVHDFMMLNSLRDSAAATAGITQAIAVLRQALEPAGAYPR